MMTLSIRKTFGFRLYFLLCLTAMFVSCRKENAIRLVKNKLGGDTTYYEKFLPVQKLPEELTFKLAWVLQKDTNLFIAKVDIADPYSIEDIVSVTGQGIQSTNINIPKYDSTLSEDLFYKVENGRILIYKYFLGSRPRDDYESFEMALVAALLFI